jgi:hypothetical protein
MSTNRFYLRGKGVRVRLIWVERDRRGTELAKRETTLTGESKKTPTRNYVAKLIARHHPELVSVDRVHLIDSDKPGCRWYVRSTELDPNRWQTVYASPLEDVTEVDDKSSTRTDA